jgi:hypothetical protein
MIALEAVLMHPSVAAAIAMQARTVTIVMAWEQ